MSEPALSALVRCRDEAVGIGRLLDGLAAQELDGGVEIVVVDSGSSDSTLDQVRRRGIVPTEIAPRLFTYGRALNLAAARARAPLCVAVSAHVALPDDGWAGRVVEAFDDHRVACAFGETVDPDLRPLNGPLLQDRAHATRYPFYGYSNSAGAFRRSLWVQHGFDQDLRASEDKEWAWHWLSEGWLCRLDPALAVDHDHDDESLAAFYRRNRDAFGAIRSFREDVWAVSSRQAAAEWAIGRHGNRSRLRALGDPRRAVMILGKYAGLRDR
ncbi:MAG: glycosyltransferase [Solirubrobacterales bacterium]